MGATTVNHTSHHFLDQGGADVGHEIESSTRERSRLGAMHAVKPSVGDVSGLPDETGRVSEGSWAADKNAS
ncbi:hypothetical protein MRX96_055386 [Rhipicephalus microplus]